MVHADARAIVAQLRQQAPEHRCITDEDDLRRGELQRRLRGALDDLVRSVVATHGVDDDAVHGLHLATAPIVELVA